MPATLEEVKKVIKDEFPDSDLDEVKEEDFQIVGIIKSKAFKSLDARDRNILVSEKVRSKFGHRGFNIGFLLPLAPGDKE